MIDLFVAAAQVDNASLVDARRIEAEARKLLLPQVSLSLAPVAKQWCTFVSLLGYEPSPLTIRVSVLPLHYREGHMPSAVRKGGDI